MLGSVGQKVMASKAREVAKTFAANVGDKLEEWTGEAAAEPVDNKPSEEEVPR